MKLQKNTNNTLKKNTRLISQLYNSNSMSDNIDECIFCSIVTGKIPGKKVYEDEVCIAVLDIKPANLGQILLIPKKHYQIFPQVPKSERDLMVKVAKKISTGMLQTGAEGINIFIANGEAAGQKSPHMLIHIIPRTQGDGVTVFDNLGKSPEKEGCDICNLVKGKKEEIVELSIEEGHSLIVPQKHAPVFEMLDDETAIKLMDLASDVSIKFFSEGIAEGTNIITQSGSPAGQKIPHIGIHVIARKKDDGKSFEWTPKDVSMEELDKVEEIYKEIIANIKEVPEELKNRQKKVDEKKPEDNYLLEQLKRMP